MHQATLFAKTIRETLAELPEKEKQQPYSDSSINRYLCKEWDELHKQHKKEKGNGSND